MIKRIRFAFLLAAAILALSLLAGCADKKGVQDDDPVVASYGETEIRRSLVDYEKQNQQALSGGKAVSDQEAVDQLLENLAMLDEAEHLGLSVSQEEVDEAFAAQQQNYEEYEDVRTAVDAWCKQVGVAPDGYFAAIRDQLPRVILRQKLRDALVSQPDVFDMDTMPAEQFRTGKFITVGLRNQIRKAEEAGYKIPVARTILITGIKDDEIWVNMSRVSGVDSTKPESYTHGEVEGRKQIYELERYLKNFVPGFENAWREKVAPFMGIRESRVIVGKYILTAEDILACRRFDDAVAVASYPVDIHHATGGDCTLHWCEDCYDIPYRSLVPAAVENLLVAGRCSSMNHEAMASTRVMSTCMALGEAAGRAARIALEEGVRPSAVDVEKVREELRQTGAYLR